MKKLFSFCWVLALLFSFTIVPASGANGWNNYISTINAAKTKKYVPNVTIPSCPPQTPEQFKALRYHKALLQRELKEIRKDTAKGHKLEFSTADSMAEVSYEGKIEKIDNLLKRRHY
jgi:hypothetical protein